MENNLWIAGYSALVTGIITFMVPGTVMMKHRARNAVEKATYYDDLCSIKNHKGFMKDAGQLLSDRTGQMAFAYIDIDNFRMINSVYSFQYGNEVLVRLSEAIREVFGEDALIGRFSGDAFGVLCHCRSCEDITGRIHELQAKVNQKCHEGKDLVLACGIHFISDEESQLDIIFDKANIARRSVKNLSNTICSVYDEDYGKKLHEENVLTEEIKEALKKKSFDVYYQPKFEFAQRKIVASEALIRWEHKAKVFPASYGWLFWSSRDAQADRNRRFFRAASGISRPCDDKRTFYTLYRMQGILQQGPVAQDILHGHLCYGRVCAV